jgi:hypothetical protein
MTPTGRRFPPPWLIEDNGALCDANHRCIPDPLLIIVGFYSGLEGAGWTRRLSGKRLRLHSKAARSADRGRLKMVS